MTKPKFQHASATAPSTPYFSVSRYTYGHINSLAEKRWIHDVGDARLPSPEETAPQSREGKVVLFLEFFSAGLCFTWISMLTGALNQYELQIQ